MLDATNAEDRDAFLATFTPEAVVDDFGWRFAGLAQIATWNDAENISTHNRVCVTGTRSDGGYVVIDIAVTGEGYNGTGTFTIAIHDGLINSMVIRG